MDIPSYLLGKKSGGGGGSNLRYVVVDELPTVGENNVIYLVPKDTSGTNNYYDEYMYINSAWELIGDTVVDLTDYVKNTDYATDSVGGVIKTNFGTGTYMSNGIIQARAIDYSAYNNFGNTTFISKGTLENVIAGKNLQIQLSTMPTASADNLGKIVQYIGTTDSTYTNGYFYKCVSDEASTPTYSWEEVEVQAGGGGETNIFPVYKFVTTTSFSSISTSSLALNNTDKNKLAEIINNAFQKGYSHIGIDIVAKGDTNNYIGLVQAVGTPGSSTDDDLQVKPNSLKMAGIIQIQQGGTYLFTTQVYFWLEQSISWDNNVATVTYAYLKRLEMPVLTAYNQVQYTPTNDYHIAHKKYVDNKPTTYTGYDATKTQVLKNVNGTLTWVTEE